MTESSLSRRIADLTPLISVIIGVAGFLFGIYQFQSQQQVQQTQQQVLQNRALEEQRKADATAALEQQLQIQNRIRTNVEALLQFINDPQQTISTAAFRFDDLNTHLNLAASSASLNRSLALTDKRTITISLVRSITDDCEFSRRRDVAFVKQIYLKWPDYTDYLRSDPRRARYIASKYCDAAENLAKKAPDVMTTLRYHSNTVAPYKFPKGYGALTEGDRHYLTDLCEGLQRHFKLLKTDDDKAWVRDLFARRIDNAAFTRDILP